MIQALYNQTLLDISIQHTGSVLNAFEISFANGISLSEKIISGTVFTIPESVKEDKEIITFFKSKQLAPASDFNMELIEVKPLGGVGYWGIENEFEVS